MFAEPLVEQRDHAALDLVAERANLLDRALAAVIEVLVVGLDAVQFERRTADRGDELRLVDQFVVVLDHVQRPRRDIDRVVGDPLDVAHREQRS